jgi:hypothetical protein
MGKFPPIDGLGILSIGNNASELISPIGQYLQHIANNFPITHKREIISNLCSANNLSDPENPNESTEAFSNSHE